MGVFSSMKFVDKVGENYLFRGPAMITEDNQFNYDGLKAAIEFTYPWIPSQYYLVDVTLVHADEPELQIERAYFMDNADKGQLVWWDTNGTDLCYFDVELDQRDFLVETFDDWLEDKLTWRVDTLRGWLEFSNPPDPSPSGVPYVFYVHCDGGCDRTAELIGGYMLRYMGLSWSEVWNEQPCGRPLGCGNYRALQWYAYWLNLRLGFNLSGMGLDGGCYDGNSRKVLALCSPRASSSG